MTDHEHGMGWRPSLPDFRDYQFGYRAALLPTSVDLRTDPAMSPIVDQGQLGSCTAHMAVAAYEFQAGKQGRTFEPRSRLFVYYNTRLLEGTVKWDSGAYCRDAFKALAGPGAPPERLWPYTISKFASRPNQKAYRSGTARQELVYQAVPQTAQAMMTVLALGQFVGIGFTVYTSFFDIGSDGLMPMPRQSDAVEGGHAICIVGYEYGQYWIARNSWGEHFGDHGYFYAPWTYFTDPNLSSDLWTVSVVEL